MDRPQAPVAPGGALPDAEKSLLRFTTSGSVDDGKSTLIGRLLYETNCIFEDQYAAVARTSEKRGSERVDLALLLDGLAAEREQGITIDVAYRYFQTARRKFIIADTPGHEQYTRNMVTGASTADLAIILIDARHGVLTQSRRHGFLISLLQIPHLVVAVNKMDLVDWRQDAYDAIVREYQEFSQKLDIHDITFIPLSALDGDNVTRRSDRMPWYQGQTLLHTLENVHVAADRNFVDFRFPVQTVLRPHLDFRGFAGTVASGTIRPGEEVVALPSGRASRVKSIETFDGQLAEAFAGQAVALTLEDEIDLSRGDMLVRRANLPQVATAFDATLCWMDQEPLNRRTHYVLKHTTNKVKAFVGDVRYRIDVNTLHREPAESFALNEIGRVTIRTARPVFFDPYKANRATGSFILVDPVTNRTAAAGMIRGVAREVGDVARAGQAVSHRSQNVQWEGGLIAQADWEKRNGHKGAVLWCTGYSGSGKSTVAKALVRELFASGCQVMMLDGDNVRHGLNRDLGFTEADRVENIRRVAEVGRLMVDAGLIVLASFISPFRAERRMARELLDEGEFVEIFVDSGLAAAEARDRKGLYAKARRGELVNFTGIDSPYEPPESPELHLDSSGTVPPEELAAAVVEHLRRSGIIP